mgnify:CR=1 FL=1
MHGADSESRWRVASPKSDALVVPMVLQKICDTCGMANPATEMICMRCFSDISGKKPVERKTIRQIEGKGIVKKPPDKRFAHIGFDEGKTVREVTPLTLTMSPGTTITVHHGDTVGRDAVGRTILQQYTGVSRQHATFKYFNGKWLVRDENSTNGTYIQGRKIVPDKWYEIKDGDTISFSSTCTFTVQTL